MSAKHEAHSHQTAVKLTCISAKHEAHSLQDAVKLDLMSAKHAAHTHEGLQGQLTNAHVSQVQVLQLIVDQCLLLGH